MYEFRNYSGVKIENEIILEVLLTIRDKMGIGLLSNYGKFLLSDEKMDEVCPEYESIDPECLSKMEISRWFIERVIKESGDWYWREWDGMREKLKKLVEEWENYLEEIIKECSKVIVEPWGCFSKYNHIKSVIICPERIWRYCEELEESKKEEKLEESNWKREISKEEFFRRFFLLTALHEFSHAYFDYIQLRGSPRDSFSKKPGIWKLIEESLAEYSAWSLMPKRYSDAFLKGKKPFEYRAWKHWDSGIKTLYEKYYYQRYYYREFPEPLVEKRVLLSSMWAGNAVPIPEIRRIFHKLLYPLFEEYPEFFLANRDGIPEWFVFHPLSSWALPILPHPEFTYRLLRRGSISTIPFKEFSKIFFLHQATEILLKHI